MQPEPDYVPYVLPAGYRWADDRDEENVEVGNAALAQAEAKRLRKLGSRRPVAASPAIKKAA